MSGCVELEPYVDADKEVYMERWVCEGEQCMRGGPYGNEESLGTICGVPEAIVLLVYDPSFLAHGLTPLLNNVSTCLSSVEFKHGRRATFRVVDVDIHCQAGDFVLVEADRGQDLGQVIALVAPEKVVHPERIQRRILRTAMEHEVESLHQKTEDEDEVLRICCEKTMEHDLPMEVRVCVCQCVVVLRIREPAFVGAVLNASTVGTRCFGECH